MPWIREILKKCKTLLSSLLQPLLPPRPPPAGMAATSSETLLVAGVCGMSLGASGLLLHLAGTPLSSPDGARAQAALFLLFLSFVIGQAMTLYGLLLSERVVPAVSKALAEKLSSIAPALFFLSLAIHAPPLLVITDGAVLLLGLELVGNGGAVVGDPRAEEPAGDVQQTDGGGAADRRRPADRRRRLA